MSERKKGITAKQKQVITHLIAMLGAALAAMVGAKYAPIVAGASEVAGEAVELLPEKVEPATSQDTDHR